MLKEPLDRAGVRAEAADDPPSHPSDGVDERQDCDPSLGRAPQRRGDRASSRSAASGRRRRSSWSSCPAGGSGSVGEGAPAPPARLPTSAPDRRARWTVRSLMPTSFATSATLSQPVDLRRRRLRCGTGEALDHERIEPGVNGRRQSGREDLGEPGIVCGGRCMHVPDGATSGGLTPHDLRVSAVGNAGSSTTRFVRPAPSAPMDYTPSCHRATRRRNAQRSPRSPPGRQAAVPGYTMRYRRRSSGTTATSSS